MINAVLRGSRSIHMNYAKELHNDGIIELNAWADISKFIKEEQEATKEGEPNTSQTKASA